MAHAAKRTIATCEHLYDGDLFDDPDKVPGLISAQYVEALSHQPKGAWPVAFGEDYGEDVAHMQIYAEASQDADRFKAYLDRYVFAEHPA